jgi:hypothetical protein
MEFDDPFDLDALRENPIDWSQVRAQVRAVLPPDRPKNESAGWVGYYAKTHLPRQFDLVDWDGTPWWFYWRAATRTYRFIEEKPSYHEQALRDSEQRVFPILLGLVKAAIQIGIVNGKSGVYVLWDADRLREPNFPVMLERLGPGRAGTRKMDRTDFDEWLQDMPRRKP